MDTLNKKIINPVEKKIIKKELDNASLICETKRGGRLVFSLTAHDCPNIMNEIGRLRELVFRNAGSKSNYNKDIDDHDTKPNPYKQLLVWDSKEEKIIAGYRYAMLEDLETSGKIKDEEFFASENYFKFSNTFKKNYCPSGVDLGRAFIIPEYQVKNNYRKGMFVLDNVWDGLGKLISSRGIKYMFGRLVLFSNFNEEIRELILYYLYYHFGNHDELIAAKKPSYLFQKKEKSIFVADGYKENYLHLSQYAKERGVLLPPLIQVYMRVSPNMQVFASAIDNDFGESEETFIMLTTEDFYPHIKKNYF